ncbi:hypothetical protein NMY22_g11486 [Coprinellus aureogranulatus]|nr:hypothetical protein NMY22_g11486 [Coprinellus aureogranulatus]
MSHLASFKDRGLKLETAASINDLFADVDLGNVTELVMSGNTIGVEAGKALAELIGKMRSLQVHFAIPQFIPIAHHYLLTHAPTIIIQVARLDNIFTTRSISEIPLALTPICTALSTLPHLTSVDLSDNAFGQRSVSAVAPLLSDGPPLEVLKLGNIGMNIEGGREIASLILSQGNFKSGNDKDANQKEEQRGSSLKTLVLSRNLLGDASASSWAKVISLHKHTLRRFESNRNDFRESGIIAIGTALLSSVNLEHLTIEDAVVANADRDNDDVEGVKRRRGYELLADVVRSSSERLKVLHLPSCAFRSAGADELVDALSSRTYPKLKSLRLEHNELTNEHFTKLLGAVKGNRLPALTFLRVTVDDETEDREHLKEIARVVEARRGKVVVLHEDDFSDEEEEAELSEEEEPVVDRRPEGDDLAELVEKLTLKTQS